MSSLILDFDDEIIENFPLEELSSGVQLPRSILFVIGYRWLNQSRLVLRRLTRS